MAISDKDRKRLWARSGNRCALCRTRLVADASEEDTEAVVGDEAHISARSPGGARFGTCPPEVVDSYDNLVLLCRTDHKKVDDQPGYFTIERLHAIKRDHHAWVDGRLDDASDVVIERDEGKPVLVWLRTGADVWNVIANNHNYYLADLDEHDATEAQRRLSTAFLQLAHDWAELSSDLSSEGPTAIRRAKDSLGEELQALAEHDLLVFGSRRQARIRGGDRPPGPWNEMYLSVVLSGDPNITTEDLRDQEPATDPSPTPREPDWRPPSEPLRVDAVLSDLLRALARTSPGAKTPTHPDQPWLVEDRQVTPEEKNEATQLGRDLGLLHAIDMHDGYWFAAGLLGPGRRCVDDHGGDVAAWRSS